MFGRVTEQDGEIMDALCSLIKKFFCLRITHICPGICGFFVSLTCKTDAIQADVIFTIYFKAFCLLKSYGIASEEVCFRISFYFQFNASFQVLSAMHL